MKRKNLSSEQIFSQEYAFVKYEADAWFERNANAILKPADNKHPVLKALLEIGLPLKGDLVDLGGGSGRVAAGIVASNCKWAATVVEPSAKAIEAGRKVFQEIKFIQGSLSQPQDLPDYCFDLVLVSGVLTWIDRALLSQAIANIDRLVKPGGYLVISDFDTPFPRANGYHHAANLFTYKQDYTLPFLALNLYSQVYRVSGEMSAHTRHDLDDPYDSWWMTAILQKDMQGRYRRSSGL